MNLTRAADAPGYAVALHEGVHAVRLQGHESGATERFWVGLSAYHPGGIAQTAPAKEETVYIVVDGELVVTADGVETALRPFDSVHFARGEVRSIENRSGREALLMVVIAHPEAAS
jgi:uncharacterized cupin superfamily protein